MRKKYKSYVAFLLALLFMGITFPELILTDDTIQIVDENGEKIQDFSELPGDAIEHIKQLYDQVKKGNVRFGSKLYEEMSNQGKQNR